MKIPRVVALAIVLLSSLAFGSAEKRVFTCFLVDRSGGSINISDEKRVEITTDSTEIIFDGKAKKIEAVGRFSRILKSTDSEITDLESGYRALATDWTNETEKGSHASVVFSRPNGEAYILQCVVY